MAINTFGGGASAGPVVIDRTPIDGTETNAVVALPGDSATDLGPSAFVFDQDTVVFRTHYDGTANGAFDLSTTQLVGTTEGAASSAAFQIPVATDLTIAGLWLLEVGTESTPYLISNSVGAATFNYALVSHLGLLKFQTTGDLTSTTQLAPSGVWVHIAAVSTSSRTSTKVYVNGVQYGSTLVTTATIPSTSSELYIGNVAAAAGDVVGGASDILVADSAYSDAAIHTLAENAFGHILP